MDEMQSTELFRWTRALCAALFLWPAMSAANEPRLLDRIVAVVGEDVIMLSELRRESLELAQTLQSQGVQQMPPQGAITKRAFDGLLLEKLQLAEAARLGIEADEETLSRTVAAVAANNNLTISEFRAALEEEGLDYQAFRDSIRDEIVIRRLRNREVTNQIQVTKSEIDSYLERSGGVEGRVAVKLRYILINAPDGASPQQREEAQTLANDVVERIKGGESFTALAQQYSNDQSALQGGELGWLDINGLPPLFQPYVATMQRGDLEGPIAVGRGFHIIQLTDVRTGASNIVRQTRARHILVRTNEVTSDEDARSRLERLRERIVLGDDFNTLARSNSDDTASAVQGGDLGWSSPGNLVPAFEEQMNQLGIDEISQPFKTQFGWHIVQVLERRDYDATDETRRDQARKAVRDDKAKDALENYLRRLRDEAYIELRLEDIES
jgi:peptidyl-prolyl cis-trans isomerase SurA